MGKIQYLQDKAGTKVYPVTQVTAVYDSSGETLEKQLSRLFPLTYTEMQKASQASGYFNASGAVVAAETINIWKFNVTEGSVYAFSGEKNTGDDLNFVGWYDANDDPVKIEPYKGSSTKHVTYTKQKIVAPEGATQLWMNARNSTASTNHLYTVDALTTEDVLEAAVLKTSVVDGLSSTSATAPLSANQGRVLDEKIDALADDVNTNIQPYENDYIAPDDIDEDTYVRNITDGIVPSQYHDLYTYVVQEGKTYAFNAYRSKGYDSYILYWGDSAGNITSRETYRGSTSAAVSIYLQEVTPPAGATRAYMNVLHNYEGYYAMYEINKLAIEKISEKVSWLGNYSGFERCPYALLSTGLFGTIGDEPYGHIAVRVQPGERYYIKNGETGTGSSSTRYAFATSDAYAAGDSVPLVTGYSVSTLQKGAGATVTIPDGCIFLIVNAPLDFPIGSYPMIEKVSMSSASRKKLRLLCLGNSYSQDALAYVPWIVENMGIELDLTIGILMMSDSNVKNHVNNFENETAAYTFYLCTPGAASWSQASGTKTIQWALETYEWDVIMTHQSSTDSSSWASKYQPYINQLVNMLYGELSYPVKFAWMLSQARPASSNSGSNWSDATIQSHYDYTSQDSERVIDETLFDIIIPVGTAIQNARTIASLKAIGDYANNANNSSGNGYLCPNDGVHLQEGLPCQIAAYSVIMSLLDVIGEGGKTVYGDTTIVDSTWTSGKSIPSPHGSPVGSTDENCKMGQMCAVMAHKKPYDVTDMNYIVNPS